MSLPIYSSTQPSGLAEDRFGGRGPLDRPGVLVVVFHQRLGLVLEIDGRIEGAAMDRLVGNQCEPALDVVKPGTVGGPEVPMRALAAGQPARHSSMLVGAEVAANQVHIEVLRDTGFDLARESQELLVATLGHALREHGAVGASAGGKQRGGARADLVMSDTLDVAQVHGQHRSRESLRVTAAFPVDAQHQRLVRGVQVQPNNVPHLPDEERSDGELGALAGLCLQA